MKSERTPWDLTKGANVPTLVKPIRSERGRFLQVERNGARMEVHLAGGAPLVVPGAANILGRKFSVAAAAAPIVLQP